MTNEQKAVVESLRSQGLGYKRIAAQTGISANTVKSYLRKYTPVPVVEESSTARVLPIDNTDDAKQSTCHQCGKPVMQSPGRKEKKFCCDRCRNLWWNGHLDLVKRRAIYHFVCPACGKEFTAYGNAHRKYCSHSCYIDDRFGGAL